MGQKPGNGPLSSGGRHRVDRERIKSRVEESLRPLTVPNFITLLRLAMIPFFILALAGHDFLLAMVIFVLAGLSDSLDGFLARALDMRSVFGAYLDPIADKLLLSTAYVGLTINQGQAVVIPVWLTILALSRDILIVVVALVLYLAAGVRRFPPSIWGKLTTFLHVVTVTVVLAANVWAIPHWAPRACFLLSFVFVMVSGAHYIYQAARIVEGSD
ncbi:MAG TPA: CDP-alcohol phosphatidyltransferase family protein [Acidobacteria bacterium]|nr:CDP-alcohol phosphatidyltransferase family protein [Acidobacteriota bacterium]